MTTAAAQIVPRQPSALPALRAADQGVTSALESVLCDNTQLVYAAQWRLFTDWCDEMGLRSMPAEPLTVARYLAVRAVGGASIAKAHQWAGHESPGRDQGVRASLKDGDGGWPGHSGKPPSSPPIPSPSSASLLRNPVPAATASKRQSRPPSAPVSTWPWWPLSPGAMCSAGTMSAAASP